MNRIFILLVVLLTTLYGFGQAGPAQSGLPTPTVPTIPATATGTTYYVENVSGSDANNGTSTLTPWKTIAKVNSSLPLASGSQVLFYSNDVWHEQLTITQSNITIGSYGPQRNCQYNYALVVTCTNMPIIDGGDLVNGWVLVTGTTYSAPWTATVTKGFVDSLYTQQAPLAIQTSLANVEATPGSIFGNGTNVYVNLLSGSSPVNHVIEVVGARTGGIVVDNGATNITNVTINGLEIIRQSICGACIDFAFGATDTGIIINNNVFFNIGNAVNNNVYAAVLIGSATESGTASGSQIEGNFIGEMDLTPANLNYNAGGIDTYSQNTLTILGNKIATTYGQAIEITDISTASCNSNIVTNNEVTNSEGGLLNLGCQTTIITNNQFHNMVGNGVEIGSCFDTGNSDCLNNGILVGYNTIHDLQSGYGTSLYNGIDVNYSTNGIAIGNTIYAVSASSMTLEGYALNQGSSGWLVENNIFDASNNINTNNIGLAGFPMFVTNYSYPNLVLKGNTFVWNPVTPWMPFNATNAGDASHLYLQAAFDAICPGCEVIGAVAQFQSINVNLPPTLAQYSEVGTPLQALGAIGRFGAGSPSLPLVVGQSGVLSTNQGGTGTAGRLTQVTGSANSIIATTLTILNSSTGLSLPPLPINTTGIGHCYITWEQATAASTVTFGIGNSVAPTSEPVTTIMSNNSATVYAVNYTAHTNTLPSAITGTNTTAVAATPYYLQVDFTVVNGAIAPEVVTIYGATGSASDALQIEPGSYCAWL